MKNFEFNGKFYGIYIDYYEIFWYKCYYKNGKIEGEYIQYYLSGNILRKYYYENGNILSLIENVME